MKKLLFISLVLIASTLFPQTLNIIKKDGQSQQINLSEIDSITFSKTTLENIYPNFQFLGNNTIKIHSQNQITEMFVYQIDSIYFNSNRTIAYFKTSTGIKEFNINRIDSITFSSLIDSTIFITYNDTTVNVINPYSDQGISVQVQGADVVVNSAAGLSDFNYVLSGSTLNGSFKIYSDKKFNLKLNNVQITNPDGAAINIQSTKKITVHLLDSTNNVLTDGLNYVTPPNNEEEDAAFYSEGQLIFTGNGNLIINGLGNDKHALCSDDYIEINSGNIKINSAKKDGINTNDGFIMRGGKLDIISLGDGIDGGAADVQIFNGEITILSTVQGKDAIKSNTNIKIAGGLINLTVQGNSSKGINSNQSVFITGGEIRINTSGNVVLQAAGSGFNPSYCTAIKSSFDVTIDSCNIIINTTGQGGRGISADRNIIIKSGTVSITSTGHGSTYTNSSGQADAYTGPCINLNGRLTIDGGQITLNHSGRGGKGISSDSRIFIGNSSSSPLINITTTGQSILISTNNYAEAKAISADSVIHIYNCNINISSADDGIKSKDSLKIFGGTIVINTSYEGLESPFLIINGGDITAYSTNDALNATMGNDVQFNDGSKLIINNGYIMVSASNGDAIDSNGDLIINGGTIVAHGPQSSPEVGVDANGVFLVTGGFLVVSGTNSTMTKAPTNTSTQRALLMRTTTQINAGTLFHLQTSTGDYLLTFAPTRRYYSIIFSSSQLTQGTSYQIYVGGASTGTNRNGLYTGGVYSGGTLRTTFTLTSMVQTVNF
jgi:hypothetical protein